ncbi:MAG: M50 family metallopeptidase [Patescibacteria group bacterium]
MTILIAVLAIIALIVVHEFGHFVAAKLSGMRVDEFGLGYPPRAFTIAKVGDTEYTFNWLPFGGFVKIYGENGDTAAPGSFSSRPRPLQAIVLIAGIAMNLLLAYLLITSALILGTPRALTDSEIPRAHNLELAVSGVMPNSPAARAGVAMGDSIMNASGAAGQWQAADHESFSAFVTENKGTPITLTVKRSGAAVEVTATPVQGLATSDPTRYAIGVEVATIGVVPLGFFEALVQGAELTWEVTKISAVGLSQFFAGVFTLSADLSQVAGPVGITVAVGDASTQGLGNLLSLIAVISISLALINIAPIPALDGGRLLFVIIESIIRRPIPHRFANAVNLIAFAFLIPLMIIVSVSDVFKLFG